jgi:hypothetical protein
MKFQVFRSILTALTLVIGVSQAQAAWQVTRSAWTPQDEVAYSEFVAKIGEAVAARRCRTTDSCLKSAANPYRNTDPAGASFYSDCADLPYVLRGYFAWKNGLPFSYVSGLRARPHARPRPIQYSAAGNEPRSRTLMSASAESPVRALRTVVNQVSSGTMRVPPQYDGSSSSLPASDFYPVDINRKAIRPGTVIYDSDGHVAVVYQVTENGIIKFIDAHPGSSITSGEWNESFARSSTNGSAGLKNFRPMRLEGATRGSDGALSGGRVVFESNASLEQFSMIQFFGIDSNNREWDRARYAEPGSRVSFHKFVRSTLAGGNLAFDPIQELSETMDLLAADLAYRVESVDAAVVAGIHNKEHPERLPNNIYGTDEMEWEIYSSPSRDARLKTRFISILEKVQEYMVMKAEGDPNLHHSGTEQDLAAELLRVYLEKSRGFSVTYKNSRGVDTRLLMEDVRQRLFKMSFDPYHCPELRWGAMDRTELASCPDGSTKMRWYDAEQRLRNQTERNYDDRMDFTLSELQRNPPGSGVDNEPNTDVESFLRSRL